ELERQQTNTGVGTERECKLVKGGAIGSTNKATGSTITPILTVATFGNSSDLWGTSWTDSDINASNFGVVYQVGRTSGTITVNVDYLRITVYYTASGGGSGVQSRYFLVG